MEQGLNMGELVAVDQDSIIKIDRMYFNAVAQVKTSAIYLTALEAGKAVLLLIISGCYFSFHPTQNSNFIVILLCAASLSSMSGTIFLRLIRRTTNVAYNLFLAAQMLHVVVAPLQSVPRGEVLSDWVSDVYDANNPENNLPNLQAELILSSTISHFYFVINKDMNVAFKFCELSLFSLVIWLIVELATTTVQPSFKVLLIIYIVFESLMRWKYVLAGLVVALSPLICVGICVAACFCRPKTVQNYVDRIQPITYRDSVQLQHGVQCMICFTNFYPDEKIVILECPAKHAFHEICIKTWFQVGTTCPVCRHDFVNM